MTSRSTETTSLSSHNIAHMMLLLTTKQIEGGGGTCHGHFNPRPHFPGGIWKRRFHSENPSNVSHPHYAEGILKCNNHRSFCIFLKLGQENMIQVIKNAVNLFLSVFRCLLNRVKIFVVAPVNSTRHFFLFLFEEHKFRGSLCRSPSAVNVLLNSLFLYNVVLFGAVCFKMFSVSIINNTIYLSCANNMK